MKYMSFSHWGQFAVPETTEYRMSYGWEYQRRDLLKPASDAVNNFHAAMQMSQLASQATAINQMYQNIRRQSVGNAYRMPRRDERRD